MIYESMDDLLFARDWIEHKRGFNKIVATRGSFDLIHPGHIKLLQFCGSLCSVVVVLLNTDESIRKHKSQYRPVNSFMERAKVLDSIKYVTYVVGTDANDPREDIMKLKPDMWVRNRTIEEILVKNVCFDIGCDVVILMNSERGSSTEIISKAASVWLKENNRSLQEVQTIEGIKNLLE